MLLASTTYAQTIPDTEVKVKGGSRVLMSDLVPKDTIVVISFWATWCGPCLKELDEINDILPELREKYPIKVVAVSVDDSRNSRKVFPKVIGAGWDFDVAIDENQEVARLMNVNNVPMIFVVDKFGKTTYSHQGYSPGTIEELVKEIEKANSLEEI